jgi:hypothetical protein
MSPKQDTWSLLFGRPTIMRATTRAKPRLAMVTLRAKPHKAAQSQAARESGATDPACVHKRYHKCVFSGSGVCVEDEHLDAGRSGVCPPIRFHRQIGNGCATSSYASMVAS